MRVSQGGSLFPCSLPKLPYVPMFPHSLRMFSYCNFSKFCSPVPKNWLMFPCSLRYFANVPLFPKTPGRPSVVGAWWRLLVIRPLRPCVDCLGIELYKVVGAWRGLLVIRPLRPSVDCLGTEVYIFLPHSQNSTDKVARNRGSRDYHHVNVNITTYKRCTKVHAPAYKGHCKPVNMSTQRKRALLIKLTVECLVFQLFQQHCFL